VYLWGLLLDGGITERIITSLCCLSTFAWIFPTISAVHFLALAFLATTFWFKECVRTGIEGLMSSESVTRDWHTVQDEEHILLDCPHEHLVNLRTQHRQLVFPPQYEDSPTRLRTFLNQPDMYGVASFVAECLAFPLDFLAFSWIGYRLYPSFHSDAPQRRK
jgi:hypothetical protein